MNEYQFELDVDSLLKDVSVKETESLFQAAKEYSDKSFQQQLEEEKQKFESVEKQVAAEREALNSVIKENPAFQELWAELELITKTNIGDEGVSFEKIKAVFDQRYQMFADAFQRAGISEQAHPGYFSEVAQGNVVPGAFWTYREERPAAPEESSPPPPPETQPIDQRLEYPFPITGRQVDSFGPGLTQGLTNLFNMFASSLAGAVFVGLTTCFSRATLGHVINVPPGYRQGEVVARWSEPRVSAMAYSIGGAATAGCSYILLVWGPDGQEPLREQRYDCGPAVAPLLWYMDVTPADAPSQLRLSFPVNPAGGQYQFHFSTYAHSFAASGLGATGRGLATARFEGFRVRITA